MQKWRSFDQVAKNLRKMGSFGRKMQKMGSFDQVAKNLMENAKIMKF
jgi:hypothetical protein